VGYRNPVLFGLVVAEPCNLECERRTPGHGPHSYTGQKIGTSTVGLKQQQSACDRLIGIRLISQPISVSPFSSLIDSCGIWVSIWSTEKEGGRPYVRLYRTIGMSTERTTARAFLSSIPARSRMYISPRKVTVVGKSLLGLNPTYHCLGL
jgi:hypothetical protein